MNDYILYIKPQALADYLMASYRIAEDSSLCVLLGEPGARSNRTALTRWCERKVAEYEGFSLRSAAQWIELDLCQLAFDAGFMDEVPNPVTKPMDLFGRVFGAYRAQDQPSPQPAVNDRPEHRRSNSNVLQFPGRLDRH